HDLTQVLARYPRHRKATCIPATFYDRDDGGARLARGATPELSLTLAANVSLIALHYAGKLLAHLLRERVPDAVTHEPRALVSDTEHPVNLMGAHAFLARAHQVDGEQ